MARKASDRQSFLYGAAILAAATALIKVIGALFKIPLVNILGSEGFSNFTVAYNIYGFFLTVSTTGLPVALSKMISEANALGRENQIKQIYGVTFRAFLTVGLLGAFIMAVFCKPLAVLMGDGMAWSSILALAPALLFVCVMSSFRGYFQGMSDMKPTAVSQIIEALGKLVFGLSFAFIIIKTGNTVFMASAGSIAGVTLGTVFGMLYLLLRKIADGKSRQPADDTADSRKQVLRRLLSLAVPITLGSSVLSLLTVIDGAVVLNRLQTALGYSASLARSLNGSYGAAQAIYNFPVAFITPMTVSIIPHISESLVLGQTKKAAELTESSMRITALIAIPAAVGLAILSLPILKLVYYSKPDVYTAGAPLLALLAPVVLANSFVLLTNAILQSNGHVKIPLYSMVIGGVMKIIINWILVGVPALNIKGAPLGSICCFGFIAVFNMVQIKRLIPEKPSYARVFIRPLICSAVMGAAAWGAYGLLERVLDAQASFMRLAAAALLSIGAAAVVYLVMVVAIKAIRAGDLELLPKGDKVAALLRIK